MKKALFASIVSISMLLLAGFVFSATVSAAEFELTINDHNPPPSNVAKAWDAWGKWVEDQSKGRIKCTIHHGGSLLAEKEAFRGTKSGVVDIAHYVVDRREGFLLSTATTLPFIGMPGQIDGAKVWMDLYNKFPEIQKEWDGVKILGIFMMPPTAIHNKKKPIVKPEDMKGMKMHGAEFAVVQTMNAVGASPIQLDITEMYSGLERGVMDGVMNHFPVLFIFKVLELTPYHTVFGEGGINMTPMFAIMNPKKFASLPPDLQKIVEESGKVWADEQYKGDLPVQKIAVDFCKSKNHTFTNLTPKQIEPWYNLMKKSSHDQWVKDAESKGLPGKKVYAETLTVIKKYSKK
jgi:TRAP-type transport system periplasmic protein